MSYMSVRYKVVVASCAALLCGVALAHFPIDVSPESDDGLLRVGWTPIQVGFTQVGLIDVCEFNYAFEVGLLNLTGRNIGVSVGAFNVESNLGDRGGDPYPWLPGLQVGLANAGGGLQAGFYNFNGCFQIGAFNADGGLQVGLFNAASDYGERSAFQVGLLNYNPHGLAKWLPIFNFSRGRKDW